VKTWNHTWLRRLAIAVAICIAAYATWFSYWTLQTTVKIEAIPNTTSAIKWRGIVYDVGTPDGRDELSVAIQSRVGSPPALFADLKCTFATDPASTSDLVENVFIATASAGSERLEVIDRSRNTRAILFAQGGKLLNDYDPVYEETAPSISAFTTTEWNSPSASEPFLWVAITKDTIRALDQRDVDLASPTWQTKLKACRLIFLVDRESKARELIAAVAAAQRIKLTGPLVLWVPLR
jgi:hypothetical protein